jgi:hypothetical protein
VTLTLMLRVDAGPTRERQQLLQQLARGRTRTGDRAPEFMLRAMYATGGLPNPLAQVLRQADTLRLSGPQADSLATLNRWFTVRADSIWSPVTKFLADLPASYDEDAAYGRYRAARRATVDLMTRVAGDVRGLLTAEQRRKLPPTVASWLDPRYLAGVRNGTAGGGGNPFGGGMGFGGGGGAMMMGGGGGGGGGGQTIIIR